MSLYVCFVVHVYGNECRCVYVWQGAQCGWERGRWNIFPYTSLAWAMLVAQSCLTLCSPMDCSLLGSSVPGILQARILQWVAIPFSKGSSWPRDQTWVSPIADRFFTVWATREAPALAMAPEISSAPSREACSSIPQEDCMGPQPCMLISPACRGCGRGGTCRIGWLLVSFPVNIIGVTMTAALSRSEA